MPLFKKKGVDTIDLTELQRKGIIEKSRKIAKSTKPDGYADLTSNKLSASSDSASPSPFSFLDSLAGASSNAEAQTAQTNNEVEKQISHIKVKIDDLEYKLERFMERIEQMEEKLKETIK